MMNTNRLNPISILKLILSLFFLAAAGVIGLKTYASKPLMESAYLSASYYMVLAVFIFWLIELIKQIFKRAKTLSSVKQLDWSGLIFCALITAFILISSQPYLRVLTDETNLLAVAKSMLESRRIDLQTMGTWYQGAYHAITSEPPARPPGFPFFIYLAHFFTGYRVENVFAVNGVILFALLYLICRQFSKSYGKIWGYIAVLLICAQPVFTQAASSGGFDLANLFFIALCFLAARQYIKEPSSANLIFFWTSGLMFSYMRYEAVFFFGLLTILLLIFGRAKIERQHFIGNLLYPLSPLLCLPLFWSKLLQIKGERPFQNDEETAAFGIQHFISNAKIFLHSFFLPDAVLPYAMIINWMGIIALGYLALLLISGSWPSEKSSKSLLGIACIHIGAYLIFFLFYYAGWANHPSCARFFIIFTTAFSVLAAIFLAEIPVFKKNGAACLILAASLFVFYHSKTVEDRFTGTQTLPRQYRAIREFLKNKKKGNIAVITTKPGMYLVDGVGAINFSYANYNAAPIYQSLLRNLYKDIYVLQEIDYQTQKPVFPTDLSPVYPLETIFEFQNKAKDSIRISKVIHS